MDGGLIPDERAEQAMRSRGSALPKRFVRPLVYVQMFALDCFTLIAAFLIMRHAVGPVMLVQGNTGVGYLMTPVYALLALNGGCYSTDVLRSQSENIRRTLMAMFGTVLVILMIDALLGAPLLIDREYFLYTIAAVTVPLTLERYIFVWLVERFYRGEYTDILVIVDGMRPDDLQGVFVLDAQALGLVPDLMNPSSLSELSEYVWAYDRVIVCCPPERQVNWALFLKGVDVTGEIVMPRANELGAIGIANFRNNDTFIISRGPLSLTNRMKKRAFDLAFTVPALIFLMPLFILVAIAIRLESPGPVFFRQRRMGQGNRMFHILKFRSMRVERSDNEGTISARRDDDRITRIGRFIRKTSIDELPQLINVLRSDMSLVGPRPHALGSLAGDQLFWEVDEKYWLRHAIKPGVTGLAQVRGLRGATHERKDLEDRLQSDLEYINGWSLWRDLAILFGTLRVLIHPNAY